MTATSTWPGQAAEDIALDAARDLNLGAATNTTTTQSSGGGSSFGGGVTAGAGQQSGLSGQFNASVNKSRTNGIESSYDNTQITATNRLTLKSGP